jgi:pimeloyl-ACP methyl ester carboxylesterase
MMPATKESWNVIAADINKLGYQVIAIDLRGHGESTKKGDKTLNYQRFSDQEHQASINDVNSSIAFLRSKGASSFAIIGASIGANLALVYAAEEAGTKTVILLSPGLEYRGVKTETPASGFNRPLLLVASDDDTYSAETVQKLAELSAKAELKMLSGAGHGTDMFSDPSLKPLILDWLKDNL